MSAGHLPAIPELFRTALGWTACGRNGKYWRWNFGRQFGVAVMADVSTAKENVKRVFYVRFLNHPIYLDLIATRPEIRLDKLENDSPDATAGPIVSAAHAYQVSSARDELPAKFHVNKDLLARAPNLLIVSTGGAGYDTVNVKDCTDAGVLVVNQTGGNADAVAVARARRDADAVEAGRPGQPRAPQGHDEGPQPLHGQRHPQQDRSASSAWATSAAASPSCARRCST